MKEITYLILMKVVIQTHSTCQRGVAATQSSDCTRDALATSCQALPEILAEFGPTLVPRQEITRSDVASPVLSPEAPKIVGEHPGSWFPPTPLIFVYLVAFGRPMRVGTRAGPT